MKNLRDSKKPLRKPFNRGAKNLRDPKNYLRVIFLIAITITATIVSQLVIGYPMLWLLGNQTFSDTIPTAIYSVLSYALTLVILLFLMPKFVHDPKLKAARTTRNDLGLNGLPTWTDIGLAPVSFITYLIIAAALVSLFTLIPGFDAEQAQDVGFSSYLTGIDRIIAFVILVVIAPIIEEIIFRGWLYGRLRDLITAKKDTLAMLIAIFLTSLTFGLLHFQLNVGVNVFAMSIVLCLLREITGTIHAGILMHMLKNGIAFYFLYVVGF